jgi:hypothetical protein
VQEMTIARSAKGERFSVLELSRHAKLSSQQGGISQTSYSGSPQIRYNHPKKNSIAGTISDCTQQWKVSEHCAARGLCSTNPDVDGFGVFGENASHAVPCNKNGLEPLTSVACCQTIAVVESVVGQHVVVLLTAKRDAVDTDRGVQQVESVLRMVSKQ